MSAKVILALIGGLGGAVVLLGVAGLINYFAVTTDTANSGFVPGAIIIDIVLLIGVIVLVIECVETISEDLNRRRPYR